MIFDRIDNAFKLCCPIRTIKTLSPKNTTKPWISGEICANVKKRQNYYSLVRQNKMSHQLYSRFRNSVINQIRQAKINSFARKFQQFKGDCRSTWKQINSIIRPNRINKKNIINKICENDITYVRKHDISNVLNSYFVNIGKRISESMNAGPYDHYQYLKGNYINSLFLAPVSSADVEEIILSLRNMRGNINFCFDKNKAPCFSCSVSYYQFVITNWYFSPIV